MMFTLLVLSVIVGGWAANTTVPFEFPLFGQCDEPWADDIMDTKTICNVGCLMSSTAMAIAGSNIDIRTTPCCSMELLPLPGH